MTIISPQGTAIAHACAHGQHPWIADLPANSEHPARHAHPPPQAAAQPPAGRAHTAPLAPAPPQAAEQLAAIFRRLNLTFRPIADGDCDHATAENQYLPSRALRHLVRARTATCTAPGCLAQAIHCDLDHTTPHPAGPTCQCNLAPKCRRHHRCKQAPGWHVDQPAPGIMRWTLPSGRTHTTTPTEYDV